MEDEEEGLLNTTAVVKTIYWLFSHFSYKMSISPKKQATSTPLVDLKISKSHHR